MVVGDPLQVADRAAEVHDGDEFVDQLAGLRTDDMGSDQLAGARAAQQFDVAVEFSQAHGFAVVVERVGGHQVGNVLFLAFPFAQPHAGHLGIAEDDHGLETIVRAAGWFFRVGGIVPGDLALLDGDVDDFVQTVDVAHGKDVGLTGAHLGIDRDAPVLGFNPGCFQRQPIDIGPAAQGLQDHLGRGRLFPSLVREVRNLQGALAAKAVQPGAGVDLHALLAETGFHRPRQVLVALGEDVVAALDQGDPGADAGVELGQFHGHGPAPQDQHRLGLPAQFKGLVAGDVASLDEAGNGDVARHRAGGDDEAVGLEDPDSHLDLMRRDKASRVFVEGETWIAQLLDAVAGEFAHQAFLARDDSLQVGPRLHGQQTEFRTPPHQGDDLPRAQDGFAGHAAPQDAKAGQGTVVDYGHVGAGVPGRAGRGVPGRAAADDDDIVLYGRSRFCRFGGFRFIIWIPDGPIRGLFSRLTAGDGEVLSHEDPLLKGVGVMANNYRLSTLFQQRYLQRASDPVIIVTLLFVAWILWPLPLPAQISSSPDTSTYTLRGYDERIQYGIDLIYNLKFKAADRYFERVIAADPDNPLGHFFLAMVTWWRVLVDLDDRAHDEAFYKLLEKCIKVCDQRLKQDRDDFDAILFKAGAIGFRGRLRGDRGQYLRAANDGLKSLPLLKRSRRMEPTNKDILFGRGIYNYFAAVMPREHPIIRPVMWFLPDGDREKGLQQLREVAEEGRYARSEAAYFLAQIYRVFERNNHKALPYLEKLYSRYPDNALFHRYTARVLADLGRWKRSVPLYQEVVRRSREGRAGYHVRGHMEALYHLGKFAFYQRRLKEAEERFTAVNSLGSGQGKEGDNGYVVLGHLLLGMTYDLQGERAAAVACYEQVGKLDNQGDNHKLARQYLETPYKDGP